MKRSILLSLTLALAILAAAPGCNKVLNEQPRASIDPAFFRTPEGLEGGIAGIYSSLRGHWSTQIFSQLFNGGTDEMVRGGAADVQHYFTYSPLMASNTNDYSGFWNSLYIDINTANGILQYGADAQMDAARKAQLLAQAKFLRAFCYYFLVTTFGDVPLHLEFNTSPTSADARAPIADVYAAIIKDLTEAAAELPDQPGTGLGKPAYKATALFLLAKTYLWRGWSAAAQASDFNNAFDISKELIDNKAVYGLDLWPAFIDGFLEGNEYGMETIMVVDHTKDLKFGQNSAPGSFASNLSENKSNFMFRPNYPTVNANYPASGGASVCVRDIQNGRPFLRIRPNMRYLLDVAFANRATDSRYDGTFQTVWLSNSTQMAPAGTPGAVTPRGTLINKVDTAIWCADRVVSPAERAAFKGIILEPEHLPGATVPFTGTMFPSLRKWDDSTRADLNDYSDRPYILFRFAEVYLIAAEAAFKGGATMQDAADMLNVLRIRAARKPDQTPAEYAAAVAAQTITPAQVTLDFILDERTRELYGEAVRWWDLARTRTLVPRLQQYNLEGGPNVKDFHMLRPIPQQQIDLVTEGPPFPQNDGYF
ncbi:RagB/SusD family nutrient uptake outer membrane protein [Chitinophaga sp. XS-30]|uniref:RagB/SusD family nutrient uptake outer membrane protein n=1 Tax=Chitinophaga sp. XS-30 TaxID=2604421 RepID=UPI0011DDF4AA|nr:RagB/SusD family nutrient uptake outer membrane protein [Chitinophaga sp. XS-30]QEH40988.1 RagB/SusD family nutrient uptake outer membrane protein [Chitinophaga sp. XS-30]